MSAAAPSALPARAIAVIRAIALFDLVVTAPLALPVSAPFFVRLLYGFDPALGGDAPLPLVTPLGWLFANLAGALGVLWALVRLAEPRASLARADALARCFVALLLVDHLLRGEGPRALLLFVASEVAGALAQLAALRAARARPEAAAGG
jgi:hypothetical protein